MWKDINGYEGLYQVNEFGDVRSIKRNKNIFKSVTNSGYYQVKLYKDSKSKNFYVHRLVSEAFIDNPNNYKEVNHKDENKLNNQVENLEWCDRIYNEHYNNKHKKTVEKITNTYNVYKDGKLIQSNKNFRELFVLLEHNAKSINSFNSNICLCANGKQESAYGYKFEKQ